MVNKTDDEFLNYLREHMVKVPGRRKDKPPPLTPRERKVGRAQPKYCELHEAMYLDPRWNHPPHADHNHENGKYRGWICMTCNLQLLPEIDRLKVIGVEKEDIKAFLGLLVDYVFTDGKVLNGRLDNT